MDLLTEGAYAQPVDIRDALPAGTFIAAGVVAAAGILASAHWVFVICLALLALGAWAWD